MPTEVSVDTIEFVIANVELGGAYDEECVEPVINGLSLVDVVKQAERRPIVWAGLAPGDLLEPLAAALKFSRAVGDRVALLRCCCGHRDCSEVTAEVHASAETVTWEAFKAPGLPAETYATLGPYEFLRSEYEGALSNPRHADVPVRDRTVVEALARGEPEDAREWLRLAYAEADWPAAGEELPTLLAGLQARVRAGNPITEAEAYRWAREMGWHEGTSGTIVGLVRAANAVATSPGAPMVQG
jgi:hypothetical protein